MSYKFNASKLATHLVVVGVLLNVVTIFKKA